jgi:glyoxylase-like metal-dependent hydrolase (beta-lactamase superfamily II)
MGHPELPSHIQPISDLDDAWLTSCSGERLIAVRATGRKLRDKLIASGKVTGVRTFDIAAFPYPTKFGLGGVARSPLPFVVMTNRVNIVQFDSSDGPKTLLFNPTDYERSAETPYFARIRRKIGALSDLLMTRRPKTPDHLEKIGLRCEDVDYIAFDHMHTQDVREMLGTTAPALGQQTPLRAIYPRAKLLIWRPELDIFHSLHPLQRTWYIPDAVRDVPDDRVIVCDGDVQLGKGIALIRTPGHTIGNWSLVINTDSGMWAVSENGVACDAYAPNASRIGGLKKHLLVTEEEVILNSNSLEGRNDQYISMVLEKTLVDRCAQAPDFFQHFPSSELTATPLTPGLGPTYSHGEITSGQLRRPSAAKKNQAA